MTNRLLQASLACLVAGFFAGASTQAKEPKLETTDTMIPSGDAGVRCAIAAVWVAGASSAWEFAADRARPSARSGVSEKADSGYECRGKLRDR